MSSPPLRLAPYISPVRLTQERRADGALLLSNPHPLRPAERTMLCALARWAQTHPDRLWLAEPAGEAGWRRLSYGEGWAQVRAAAAGLRALGLPAGAAVAILSGNSLAHAVMSYACALAGLAACPVTPAYSLAAPDARRLCTLFSVAQPAAIFVEGGPAFQRALDGLARPDLPVIQAGAAPRAARLIAFERLLGADPAPFDPDAIDRAATAKLMLTSGSTGLPKAVVMTHANLCDNAAQIRSVFDPALEARCWPDGMVMVNSLPWSHSLGGNAVLHMLTTAGGSLYIDWGAPTPGRFGPTLAALSTIAPDYHIAVPAGWALLCDALERDEALAQRFFARLRIMQYGGASLPADLVARLQALAARVTGERITLAAGYGATETAPTVCNVHWPNARAGLVGLPVPGLTLKLTPFAGKLEARVKGPGVTPGYLHDAARTAAAFDEEGYFKLGDALRFADPDQPEAGLAFDGRIAEEFKLASGVWVNAGAVRTALVAAGEGLFQDAVICGENEAQTAALIFLAPGPAQRVAGAALDLAGLAAHPAVREAAAAALARLNAAAPPSRQIARALLLPDAPDSGAGEITDKGSLNQALCRTLRAGHVAALFAAGSDPRLILPA